MIRQLALGERVFDAFPGPMFSILTCLLAQQVLQLGWSAFAGFDGRQSIAIAMVRKPTGQRGESLQGLLETRQASARKHTLPLLFQSS